MLSSSAKAMAARRARAVVALLALGIAVMLVAAPLALAKPNGGAKGGTHTVRIAVDEPVVLAGSATTITATVKPVVPNTKVTLYAAGKGTADWVVVGTKTITSGPNLTFTYMPTRHTTYKAVWAVDSQKLNSNIRLQMVRADLTVNAMVAPYVNGKGTPVIISGVMKPAWNGNYVAITILRWVDDEWLMPVTRLQAELTPGAADSSNFSVTWQAMQSGDYVVRAKVVQRGSTHFLPGKAETEFSL